MKIKTELLLLGINALLAIAIIQAQIATSTALTISLSISLTLKMLSMLRKLRSFYL